MKIKTGTFPFALTFTARSSDKSFLRFIRMRANMMRASRPLPLEGPGLPQTNFARCGSRAVTLPSIYVVDEVPRLTELYATLLESAGYLVRTFNHRVNALAALNGDRSRPALLITNYHGSSMPVNHFLQACRLVQPTIRILMASGFDQSAMRFSKARPDRFIQKPFTPEEFQHAISAVLAE